MANQDKLTEQRNQRFLALMEPIWEDCQRWAYSLTRDNADASDVMQQAVLQGLEHFHQLRDEGAFKTWMFRIIKTSFMLWLRSEKRQPEAIEPQTLPRLEKQKDDWTEREARADALRIALDKLAPEQREALVLFEMQGLSSKEICKVMGKKNSAVRVLLHRSRARLAELLKEQGIEL